MIGLRQQRRRALAERHDVRGVDGVGDVQRHQRTETPQVAAARVVPLRIGLLGREAFQVEHHLDRPAIGRVEVHGPVGGVLDAGSQAAQATNEGHESIPVEENPSLAV